MTSATIYDPEAKIWTGAEEDYDSTMAMSNFLLDHLKSKDPEKVLQRVHDTGEEMTAKEMLQRSYRLAHSFKEVGIIPGEVVTVIARSLPNVMPVSIGLFAVGAIINYMDETNIQGGNEDCLLRRVSARVIICESGLVDSILDDLRDDVILMTFDDNGGRYKTIEDLVANYEKAEEFTPVPIKDPTKETAVIMSSSGTTGKPKFICLSHGMIISQIMRCTVGINVGVTYHYNPLYYISGIDGAFGGVSRGKCRIITTLKSTPENISTIVQAQKVTDMFVDPSTMVVLMQYLQRTGTILDSVNMLCVSGTSVSEQLRQAMEVHVPHGLVIVAYGLTEVAGVAAAALFPKGFSVGYLLKGIKMKVISEDGTKLGQHQIGEICIKMAHDYVGYYNNEPARETVIDDDGWYHSNDMGYFDEDDFLFILGRKYDRIEYHHNVINPVEIEALLESHPDVSRACVVGVKVPVYYEIPTAIVIRKDGRTVTADELHAYLEDKLPNDFYRLRGGIFFVESFPITKTGKIKKNEIKDFAIKSYFAIKI